MGLTSILPDYGVTTRWRHGSGGLYGLRGDVPGMTQVEMTDLVLSDPWQGEWRTYETTTSRPVDPYPNLQLPETPGAGTVVLVQDALRTLRTAGPQTQAIVTQQYVTYALIAAAVLVAVMVLKR